MNSGYNCKNCGIAFIRRRNNQLYCSNQCRHAHGNETFKNKMAAFEADKRNAIAQDLVLRSIFRRNRKVLIDQNKFKELKIDVLNAKTIYYRADGRLISAVFTNFLLERIDDLTFELKQR